MQQGLAASICGILADGRSLSARAVFQELKRLPGDPYGKELRAKDVNRVLYNELQGKVVKQTAGDPPLWTSIGTSGYSGARSNAQSRGRSAAEAAAHTNTFEQPVCDSKSKQTTVPIPGVTLSATSFILQKNGSLSGEFSQHVPAVSSRYTNGLPPASKRQPVDDVPDYIPLLPPSPGNSLWLRSNPPSMFAILVNFSMVDDLQSMQKLVWLLDGLFPAPAPANPQWFVEAYLQEHQLVHPSEELKQLVHRSEEVSFTSLAVPAIGGERGMRAGALQFIPTRSGLASRLLLRLGALAALLPTDSWIGVVGEKQEGVMEWAREAGIALSYFRTVGDVTVFLEGQFSAVASDEWSSR
eukprot:GHVS01068983.1.p1 GENE.GHVS01068983.1~~GHVS01068983.1.p1  ORF type:complete len:355 (+),score=40.45 GHVS01068983.1:166-1230(+)